MTSYEILT